MTDTPPYNPAIHHRRSIRLQGYDYSQAGAYFITICTHNRECLFGTIGPGSVRAGSVMPGSVMPGSVGAGSKSALLSPQPAHLPQNRTGLELGNRAGLEPAPTQSIARMVLNEYGEIVQHAWNDLPDHVDGIELDAFVVMPNHVHGIIVLMGAGLEPNDRTGLEPGNRAGLEPAPTRIRALSEIVRQLKTFSARRLNNKRGTRGKPVWQRNYWEHVVRDESELHCIREYIHHNPARWESDKLFVQPSVPGRHEIREPAADYGLEAWMV